MARVGLRGLPSGMHSRLRSWQEDYLAHGYIEDGDMDE